MVNSLTAVSLPCFSFPCSMCPSRKILGCFQTVFSLAFGFINKIMDQFVGLGLVWFLWGVFCLGFLGFNLLLFCFVNCDSVGESQLHILYPLVHILLHILYLLSKDSIS